MAWPETADFDLEPPEGDGEWELPSWVALVRRNEAGELHHGTRGASLPETVIVRVAGEAVALADIFAHALENQYCWDCEYYLVLRVREVLDEAAWAGLPWGQLGAGDVFVAYDKFHGHEYLRTPDDGRAMSYGGDWSDLQAYIDEQHPRPEGPRVGGPPSPTTLLRAIRDRDVARVRALLAAGADPEAGSYAPYEALRSVSVDRATTALWEAIGSGVPELVEALLAAGARVHPLAPDHMPPLHGAILQRQLAMVPVLLRFGADPELRFQGRTAYDLAAAVGLEALALLPPRRGAQGPV